VKQVSWPTRDTVPNFWELVSPDVVVVSQAAVWMRNAGAEVTAAFGAAATFFYVVTVGVNPTSVLEHQRLCTPVGHDFLSLIATEVLEAMACGA